MIDAIGHGIAGALQDKAGLVRAVIEIADRRDDASVDETLGVLLRGAANAEPGL